jgi:hypothetical protein
VRYRASTVRPASACRGIVDGHVFDDCSISGTRYALAVFYPAASFTLLSSTETN